MTITIEDLRRDWSRASRELSAAIGYLEAGNKIYPVVPYQDPGLATQNWMAKLRRDKKEFDALLRDYPATSAA